LELDHYQKSFLRLSEPMIKVLKEMLLFHIPTGVEKVPTETYQTISKSDHANQISVPKIVQLSGGDIGPAPAPPSDFGIDPN